jgi:hypothetical protein
VRDGEGGLGYAMIYANSQMETSCFFAMVLAATVPRFSFLSSCFMIGRRRTTGTNRAGCNLPAEPFQSIASSTDSVKTP